MALIRFPQHVRGRQGIEVHPGLTILEYLRKAGIMISAECGGSGTCGRCVVRIEEGQESLNRHTEPEKKAVLQPEERLACQARVIRADRDITVYVKNVGSFEILKYGMERQVPLCPAFRRREGEVLVGDRRVDGYRGRLLGLAVDLGTTTIVMDLVDLETGDILETVAKANPQISYGNDVISRIRHVLVDQNGKEYLPESARKEKVDQLRCLAVGSVNCSLQEMGQRMGEDISSCVYEVLVAGNSTMRNLFLGLDVSSLGILPFEPSHPEAVSVHPGDIGLQINPAGSVYGASLIGGHVGADILADILASEIYRSEDIAMIVDIGTNGEIVLGNRDRLIATSCAAGGAFEGSTVGCGVGGIEGAIRKIAIVDGRVECSTIGSRYPVGICGSGLIDLLAEMLRTGAMDRKARMEKDFLVTADIRLTQQDVFQLITSKAAIKTGMEVLMNYFPVDLKDVRRIYLSGGFANFIDTANAMRIGLLPKVEEERVIKIGNGSLEGAREMLLCTERRALSEEIARSVRHVRTNELEKDFEYLVAANMYFDNPE